MEFNYPIFAFALSGNKRDECAKLNFVCFASYDKPIDKTMVFVRIGKLDRTSRRETKRALTAIFSKIGSVLGCNYFESGAEVVVFSSN